MAWLFHERLLRNVRWIAAAATLFCELAVPLPAGIALGPSASSRRLRGEDGFAEALASVRVREVFSCASDVLSSAAEADRGFVGLAGAACAVRARRICRSA